MHNPFVPPKGKLVEFWKILEQLKDDGTITASLGVSNFRPQVRLSPSPGLALPRSENIPADSPCTAIPGPRGTLARVQVQARREPAW